MEFELLLTPAGHLIAPPVPGAGHQAARLAKAFASGQAEGLLTLANEKLDAGAGPVLAYWRGFAGRYLTELCHTPETTGARIESIAPPATDQLFVLVLGAPPMPGAEYLFEATLEAIWTDLDAWVRQEVEQHDEGLTGFLRQRAPLWHQVGRVCFHLAENKRDPDNPFAFLATFAPSVAAGGRVQYQPLSRALQQYAGEKNQKALMKLLSPVQQAAENSPLVMELLKSGDLFHPLAWSPRQAYGFLQDAPRMEESGILVRLPDWWKKRPRPRVGVTIGEKRSKTFGANAMLDFQVHVALGDETLTDEEWAELLGAEDGLVLIRGQWVEVDRKKLAEALDQWKAVQSQASDGVSFIEGMRLLAGAPMDLNDEDRADPDRAWSFVTAGEWLGKLLANLRSPEQLGQAAPGDDLKATLRPYQATGVNWLWFLSSLGLGACLADDMGLGKTVQVLGLLTVLKRQRSDKPSLLVLPASLLANWKSEIARFAPSLRALFVHPSETAKDQLAEMTARPDAAMANADVVLTTYGMLLRQPWLSEADWRLVALDEAQAIKNPGSRQTKAVKRLRAEARIVLTGTPVENRLSDLWSLFDFLSPGLLGSQRQFKEFVKRLESRSENRYAPLRNLVQPYILRRLKTDKRVIADLPEKTEVRAFCGLGKRQAALYSKMVDEMARALEDLDGMQRRGLVLAYLMRFKQLCNHPSHLLGDGQFEPDASGKFLRLGEICEEIASRQEKALVFTQFREMADPLAGFLAGVFGRSGLVLHGGTAVKGRKRLVDQFQADDGPPFFVLSLKAGGTGLNLTAASHVIHFDRWWNPAVENQATDRAFRIGQKRNVLVHKFITRGTIE
ncbi:MAG: DEAD/DEAH box helicase, partial [Patescibacteria group bacterium]|nr:DEAD/DEAH box helicase [Patescibacteria group bacterium]